MITPQTRRQASQILNELDPDADDIGDMRSALDRTIDKIGMGWCIYIPCVQHTDKSFQDRTNGHCWPCAALVCFTRQNELGVLLTHDVLFQAGLQTT